MNRRIRYNKVTDDTLVSRRTFSTNTGREVVVELNLGDKKYKVRDATTQEVIVIGGSTTNLAVLKIQAKRGLKQLGVQFGNETRNRNDRDTAQG